MSSTAGRAISSNITPQTSQPHTMPSGAAERELQEVPARGCRTARAHIGISRFGALSEMAHAEPTIAVMIMTGMAIAISPAPSGHGWALTYGPPSAHAAADGHHRAHREERPGERDPEHQHADGRGPGGRQAGPRPLARRRSPRRHGSTLAEARTPLPRPPHLPFPPCASAESSSRWPWWPAPPPPRAAEATTTSPTTPPRARARTRARPRPPAARPRSTFPSEACDLLSAEDVSDLVGTQVDMPTSGPTTSGGKFGVGLRRTTRTTRPTPRRSCSTRTSTPPTRVAVRPPSPSRGSATRPTPRRSAASGLRRRHLALHAVVLLRRHRPGEPAEEQGARESRGRRAHLTSTDLARCRRAVMEWLGDRPRDHLPPGPAGTHRRAAGPRRATAAGRGPRGRPAPRPGRAWHRQDHDAGRGDRPPHRGGHPPRPDPGPDLLSQGGRAAPRPRHRAGGPHHVREHRLDVPPLLRLRPDPPLRARRCYVGPLRLLSAPEQERGAACSCCRTIPSRSGGPRTSGTRSAPVASRARCTRCCPEPGRRVSTEGQAPAAGGGQRAARRVRRGSARSWSNTSRSSTGAVPSTTPT